MLSLFQWFLLLLGLATIWRTFLQYKKRNVSMHWFVLWTGFWFLIFVVASIPKTADILAQSVGVGRGADLFVYCAILVLFYGLYRALSRSQRQQEEITNIVRRIGIIETLREQKKS